MVTGMHSSLGRRDAVAMAMLGLIGVGIPLGLASAAGAIGLPAMDDWVYTRGADSLFRTGSVDMPGHTASAIGQIVMVQPLLWLSGGNPWAFAAFGLLMTAIGVAATYLLARHFVGCGAAVMVVLLVVAFPGFARESVTFMTDVPAYSLTMLCLLLGTSWLESGRRMTLVASLAMGLLAISVREFAIAAPAALLVVGWTRSNRGERAWLAGASGAFGVALAGVLIAAASVAGRTPPNPYILWSILLGPVFVTLAAVLLPAVVLGLRRRLDTLSPSQMIVGAGLACLAVLAKPWASHAGDSWMREGLGGDLLLHGSRGPVVAVSVWAISAQIALYAAILVAGLALRWSRQNLSRVNSVATAKELVGRISRGSDGLLVVVLAANIAELLFFSPFIVYDRYLYPMVPVGDTLILRGSPQPSQIGMSHAFSHAAFAWLATFAAVIATNSFAYDAARWRAGEELVAMGYDARTVDAGYEWVGYHASLGESLSAPATDMTWNIDRWKLLDPCAVLSNSPLNEGNLTPIHVNRSAYRQYLFFGPDEPLYFYGASSAACPAPPGA